MARAEESRVHPGPMGGGYRWVLRSGSGEKLAESGGAVRDGEKCLARARAVLSGRPSATLRDLTRPPGTGPWAGDTSCSPRRGNRAKPPIGATSGSA